MPSKTSPARPEAASSPRARKSPRRASAPAGDAVTSAPEAASAVTEVKPRSKATTATPAASKTRRPRGRAAVEAASEPAATAAAVPAADAVVEVLAEAATPVPVPEAAADAPARGRRRSGRARRAEAAAEPAAEAEAPAIAMAGGEPDVEPDVEPMAADAEEPAAQAPAPERGPSRRSRSSRGRRGERGDRESGTPAPGMTPAAPIAAPAPLAPRGPLAEIEAPADGVLFGRYAVRVPGEEAAEVCLRSPHPGTAVCTCLDFALSEHAECPHVQALWSHLQADADRAAAFARGPQAVGSRIALLHGSRRRLLWLPGTECPASLNDLAEQLLGVPPDQLDDQAVPRLLRAARDAGHELQVDETAWAHLAAARDARWRVQRLEALFPQGPASAELQLLGTTAAAPLLPLQVEGALLAVCAGRCILADAPELQPMQQALAAALLMQRHFGVERVLLLAPGAVLDRWRRALPADASGWNLTSIDSVATDIDLHRSLAPHLVIVHEADEGGLWVDAERAAALLRLHSPHALVLPAPGWLQRPAELPLRVAFVDADRLGGYDALLQAHGERDEHGELCGLHDLDGLRGTLAPMLLARTLDEVRGQLPERIDHVRRVPLPAAVRGAHAARAQTLADAVARWQRLGWLPDAEQRRLVDQVQALRRLCAGDGVPAVADAKADALRALLDGGDAPVAKAVVFSQWPTALQAVQQRLAAAGIATAFWQAADREASRQAEVQRFQTDPACRVLLLADPGSGALELRCPGAQVVHLDRPWNPRLLSRRFGRVHRRGKAHLVPVTQLLLEGSFEDAACSVLAERREPPVADLLDANAGEGFVQGEACLQWLADLAAVLQACGHASGAAAA